MRYFIFCLIVIFSSCFKDYPKVIVENELEKKYDIARWRMYTTNYRNKYVYFQNGRSEINIVSCKLQLEDLIKVKDTIDFRFSFFYPDSNMNCMPGNLVFINTIMFINNSDFPFVAGANLSIEPTMIDYQRIVEQDTLAFIDDPSGKFYPFWSEKRSFAEFLKTTNNPLDPWLKKEAIKRGILKE